MRETLTTRDQFTSALVNSGAHELDSYSRLAIQESNKGLAGAVISRIDRLSKEQKSKLSIRKDDLAEIMVYETFRAAVEVIAIGELNILLGELEGREALAQELNAGDTRKIGLKKLEVEKTIGRALVEDDLAYQPIIGEPKKPAEKPAETKKPEDVDFTSEALERAASYTRFVALYGQDERTPDEQEEMKKLGHEYGWIETGDD